MEKFICQMLWKENTAELTANGAGNMYFHQKAYPKIPDRVLQGAITSMKPLCTKPLSVQCGWLQLPNRRAPIPSVIMRHYAEYRIMPSLLGVPM
jgi:hypothetical protein